MGPEVPLLLLALGRAGAAALVGPQACAAPSHAARRGGVIEAQFGFKVQKSERLLIREAWEKADAYRPGKPNWFTQGQKDLVDLHKSLLPLYDTLPPSAEGEIPGAGKHTSKLGALLKSLTTGDLALTLCSKEPPVLTELRDWLITALSMPEAVRGLPEEQGRVLATIVRACDARTILDLGTFTGYSSIAMALAAADDAKVICCEPDAQSARHARDWWLKAGCSSKMQMHEVGAEELLTDLLGKEGMVGGVDVVFCDVGERERYAALHEQIMQLLHVGGIVIYYDTLWPADSVLEHEPYSSMRSFNTQLASDPRVLASLVPLSYGLTICMKTMELDGEALAAARGEPDGLRRLLDERRAAAQSELEALS